jgi:methionine-rich copper-binding protein CopC
MRSIFLPTALALSASPAQRRLIRNSTASPTANATVDKPARIELRFSEKLMPKFSGADLMMTGHGATHAPMKITTTAAVAGDGSTLVLTPKAPLAPGRYTVAWHVVSSDTHRVAGNYTFAVK